ncbi:hypothetical protein, partial [Neisseria sicca]|uniref:hypothetical protein n=1 Tax=Neisseria sicca TaxID=490 RepID=UPI003F68A4EF
MYYPHPLIHLPSAVFGPPLATIFLPTFSNHPPNHNTHHFSPLLHSPFPLSILLTLPPPLRFPLFSFPFL